ncbi:MAG TPA: LytTR family DNA-binding domain-containing protein [Prolixibacteraceae bacterium]|nr:LytTR family DNA-binding domain-containing protein [Prolixibacteraceae bacterium]
MNIVIVEDEKYTADLILRLIKKYNSSYHVVGILSSVDDTVQWFFRQPERVDLIFMDIQLTDGTSFEIFEKVSLKIPVIFITAYDEFAINAFRVNCIDYLLKPVNYTDLENAFRKFYEMKEACLNDDLNFIPKMIGVNGKSYKKRFLIKKGSQYFFISENEIAFFEFEEGVVFACLKSGKRHMLNESLDELNLMLDPIRFFRLNRKIISSAEAIISIQDYFNRRMSVHLQPSNKQEIVSRERVSDFKQWLNR